MSKTLDKLSPEIVNNLQGEKIINLITLDKQGEPHLSAVSWVRADEDGEVIKIAVGHKSSTVKNIEQNENVTLGVIADGSYYSVKGTASVSEVIEKTMKYRVIYIQVNEVQDATFYGGKITVEPAYEKTYDADLAKKLDEEIYESLK
ncbi:pyridoxamine 5'-phosphate oxidase family protein [Pseudalkalibacillus sp. A8]|uniref:pyridoxamine 5'-phosphate oxidase family protein n=1 Tax=Pseudalkalibacillus sp. A8 TaxID=3382641 RepID=UPI0038B59BAD